MADASVSPPDAPRVLFVTSAAFNHVTGGGITFSNLFRGWPKDRLATVHNDQVPVAHDVCDTYYSLGSAEIGRWLFPAAEPDPSSVEQWAAPKPASRLVRPTQCAKRIVIGNAWPDTGRLSPQLEAWIEDFRPQVMYTILGTIGMMELIDTIRRRFNLPTIVHFMDDWPSHLYRGGAVSFVFRRRMHKLIQNLVGSARQCLAIGDTMAESYERRYRRSFGAFQNPINPAVIERLDDGRRVRSPGGPTKVVYMGSVFDNAQAQSLIEISRAVAILDAEGQRFALDIYSPLHLAEPFRQRLEVPGTVRLHDTLTDDDAFFELIGGADILVLPINFDATSIRLIRYSMPTKLPSYIASGTPILVYGPAGTAQVEDARQHGWGLVVDHRGLEGVRSALLRLRDDTALSQALTTRGRALALERHNAEIVRPRFQRRLADAL